MGEMLNNASKSAERAPYAKGTRQIGKKVNIIEKAIRSTMYLKGFSLNSAMGFQNSMSIALSMSGRATMDDRKEAARLALSYATQIVVFNGLKVFMLAPAYNILGDVLIGSLFGVDDKEEPEESKRKRLSKRVSQFWYNSAADAILGYMPAPLEAAGKGASNWLYSNAKQYRFEAYKNDPEAAMNMFGRTIPPSLKYDSRAAKTILKGTTLESKYNPFFISDNTSLGSAGMIGDLAGSFVEAVEGRKGKQYSEETNANLDKMDIAKTMALITGQGDMLKVMYGMERQIKFQDGLSKKPKGSNSNPIKQVQKQFKTNAFKDLKLKPTGL